MLGTSRKLLAVSIASIAILGATSYSCAAQDGYYYGNQGGMTSYSDNAYASADVHAGLGINLDIGLDLGANLGAGRFETHGASPFVEPDAYYNYAYNPYSGDITTQRSCFQRHPVHTPEGWGTLLVNECARGEE